MSIQGETRTASTAPDGEAGGGAQQATEQAKERVQETAQQAAGQARDRVRQQVDQRSTDAGQRVSGTAGDVREIAGQLRERGKDGPARLAEQAADRAERLGGYLERSDADRILADVEDFGRRQPMAVMLGGLALGFAASRFLKASSQRRHGPAGTAGYSTGAATGTPAPAYTPATPPSTPPTAHPEPRTPPPVTPSPTTPPPTTPGAPAADVSLTGGVRHGGPERPV